MNRPRTFPKPTRADLVAVSLLALWAVSIVAPGGFVAWTEARPVLAAIGLALWLWCRRRCNTWMRLLLPATVLASLLELGYGQIGADACGDRPIEERSFDGWTCTVIRRECGATISDQYRVVAEKGHGWSRRERVVLDAYRSPIPFVVAFDGSGLRLGLRHVSSTKLDTLLVAPSGFGDSRSFYDDMLR